MAKENVVKASRIVVLVVAVLMGATACSGDDKPSADKPSPTSAPTTQDTGIISPADLPKIPKFTGKTTGIINDTVQDSCDTAPGPVNASGTVTNSGSKPQDLVVVISWAVTSTSDVVARGVATLKDVAAGDTVDWSVKADLKSTETVACVMTALRGDLR
jgi:hypothetical protein